MSCLFQRSGKWFKKQSNKHKRVCTSQWVITTDVSTRELYSDSGELINRKIFFLSFLNICAFYTLNCIYIFSYIKTRNVRGVSQKKYHSYFSQKKCDIYMYHIEKIRTHTHTHISHLKRVLSRETNFYQTLARKPREGQVKAKITA